MRETCHFCKLGTTIRPCWGPAATLRQRLPVQAAQLHQPFHPTPNSWNQPPPPGTHQLQTCLCQDHHSHRLYYIVLGDLHLSFQFLFKANKSARSQAGPHFWRCWTAACQAAAGAYSAIFPPCTMRFLLEKWDADTKDQQYQSNSQLWPFPGRFPLWPRCGSHKSSPGYSSRCHRAVAANLSLAPSKAAQVPQHPSALPLSPQPLSGAFPPLCCKETH